MRIRKYEEFVLGLMSPDSVATEKDKLTTMALGLGGEAGEVIDLVKKLNYHGLQMDDSVREKIVKELGDVMFYVTFAAREVCGIGLKEIMKANRDKLSARYKSGKFSREEFLQKEQAKKDA